MKKIVLILLISIYSLSTFGVSLKEFYCCGKLKSVTLTLANEGKEKCGKGDSKNGCCKTKIQSFKVKDSHLAAAHLATPLKYYTELYNFTTSLQPVAFANCEAEVTNGSHAPPLYRGVPVYISNCVFRI